MQTRSSRQHRNQSESSDRVTATIKPRPWSDPHQHQAAAQPQPIRHDFSHVDLFAHDPGPRTIDFGIQPKLTIGAPNDMYEQEADRVAAQVVEQINAPASQSTQGQTVQRQEEPKHQATQPTRHNFSHVDLFAHDPGPRTIPHGVQAKLTIGAPNDVYEQEADRLAAQVVQRLNAPPPNLPSPARSQSDPSVQRETLPDEDELQMKPMADRIQRVDMPEEEELQMKSVVQRQAGGEAVTASANLESSIQQARGGGQPLADPIRQPMEQAFGADFSGVKVHTDSQSDQLNRSIQAKAFTTKQDVFFRQGAYEPGSRSGQELIAHELTHVVQQNGSAVQRSSHRQAPNERQPAVQLSHRLQRTPLLIQRIADPTSVTQVDKIIISGTANYGVFLLRNGQNETVAVKFSTEDTRRAAFADKVLESAGLQTTKSRVASSAEVAQIVQRLEQIGHTYALSTDAGQRSIAATIEAKAQKLHSSASVLIMESAPGADFNDVLRDNQADHSFLATPHFHEQLGRLVAADAILGNSDRLATIANKDIKVKATKTTPEHVKPGLKFVILNEANFRVLANGTISTIDNDTELAGLKLLQGLGKITNPADWANFLIAGGDEHITPTSDNERAKERVTQSIEDLFDATKRRMIYDELRKAVLEITQQVLPITFDAFDVAFTQGLTAALKGMQRNMGQLLQDATDIGGDDAGGGYIDPDALEQKLRYTQERESGIDAADAQRLMVFRVKTKSLLQLPDDLATVPIVPLTGKLEKVVHKLVPDKEKTKAHKVKNKVRAHGLSADKLKELEQEIDPAKTGKSKPDRSVPKALLTARIQRFILHLTDSAAQITNIYKMMLGKDHTRMAEWLKTIDFRNRLKSTYKETTNKYISELAKAKEEEIYNQLTAAYTQLLQNAEWMEQNVQPPKLQRRKAFNAPTPSNNAFSKHTS